MILCLNGNSCWCVFGSASTLKEQFDDEKVALQQSIHKNGALIAEKEQLVQNLKSEVGIKHAGALKNSSRVFDSPVMRAFACCNLKKVCFPAQLAKLHGEGASVRSLQGAVEALEQDKAVLQERALRLEKELAAAKNTLNVPSGKPWRPW